MKVFVDTSAFLALLDAHEQNHANARRIWTQLVQDKAILTCTNYVLLETIALAQNRLGLSVLRAFQDNIVPYLDIVWVDRDIHHAGIVAVLAADRRKLSLVDCTSFAVMRQMGIDTTFAFDQHFIEQGFTCLT
ncbi:MAG: PIN domain-containing protein [Chloroflexota bacterium]